MTNNINIPTPALGKDGLKLEIEVKQSGAIMNSNARFGQRWIET